MLYEWIPDFLPDWLYTGMSGQIFFFPSPLSTFEVETEFNSYRDRVVWWNHMAFPLLVRLSVGWGYQFIVFAKHQGVDNISELKAVNTNWGKWKFLFTWY